MADKRFVQSVIKALNIIELLGEHGELGVTDISTRLGFDKSTTFRLLATLKEKNFIVNDSKTQLYSNSTKLFALGQSVLRKSNFGPQIKVELKKLMEITGETVNFSIPDGLEVVYVDKYETADMLKLVVKVGQRRPMYCTSAGKALLAYYDRQYVETLCDSFQFVRFTEYTITDKDALLKELDLIRKRGYSLDNQEHCLDIRCVAIPILNKSDEPLAAVSISMPQFRYEADTSRQDKCIKALLDASETLSKVFLGS